MGEEDGGFVGKGVGRAADLEVGGVVISAAGDEVVGWFVGPVVFVVGGSWPDG